MRPFHLYCAAVLAAFVFLEARGTSLLPTSHRQNIQPSVRGSPGAYRSYRTSGGGGFRGGK